MTHIGTSLYDLGYNTFFEKYRNLENLSDYKLGRVMAEHKERYIVITPDGEYNAEITGNIRYTASGRQDFPADPECDLLCELLGFNCNMAVAIACYISVNNN